MASDPYFLTYEEITDQILAMLPPQWRANMTGKVLKRLIVAYAIALEALYALLARLLRLSIISTSEGGWLRAIVAGIGMETYSGIQASVGVKFERFTAGVAIAIPQGTKVVAVGGQIFSTNLPIILAADSLDVVIPCTAVEAGVQGNIAAGSIIGLVNAISGIDQVSNPNPGAGGDESESDASVKARIPGYLDSLHRATIPATEGAIALDRDRFPSVRQFITQRNFGTPGYFRAILSDASGSDLYRAAGWISTGNGVFYLNTSLPQIDGLVSAGYPCKRFGVVTRTTDGAEVWRGSTYVTEVEQGNWRFCHDMQFNRLYARADGRDLSELSITIVAGVIGEALTELESRWAGNGIYCDVLVPFQVSGDIQVAYTLEPLRVQSTVEIALRNAISDYARGLGMGDDFELEGFYAAMNRVEGAASITAIAPASNISVPADSVFRLTNPPIIERRSL